MNNCSVNYGFAEASKVTCWIKLGLLSISILTDQIIVNVRNKHLNKKKSYYIFDKAFLYYPRAFSLLEYLLTRKLKQLSLRLLKGSWNALCIKEQLSYGSTAFFNYWRLYILKWEIWKYVKLFLIDILPLRNSITDWEQKLRRQILFSNWNSVLLTYFMFGVCCP